MASSAATAGLLSRQFKQMQGDKDIPGISCGLVNDNVFEWEVMLMISDECKYYGGKSGARVNRSAVGKGIEPSANGGDHSMCIETGLWRQEVR